MWIMQERVQQLFRIFADEVSPIESVGPGDIAAAFGLRETATGDTLISDDVFVELEGVTVPEPGLFTK